MWVHTIRTNVLHYYIPIRDGFTTHTRIITHAQTHTHPFPIPTHTHTHSLLYSKKNSKVYSSKQKSEHEREREKKRVKRGKFPLQWNNNYKGSTFYNLCYSLYYYYCMYYFLLLFLNSLQYTETQKKKKNAMTHTHARSSTLLHIVTIYHFFHLADLYSPENASFHILFPNKVWYHPHQKYIYFICIYVYVHIVLIPCFQLVNTFYRCVVHTSNSFSLVYLI